MNQPFFCPSDIPILTWDKFVAYHDENRHIWESFEGHAFKAINVGVERWGAKGIFEVIRWDQIVEKQGEFKANNNYAAYYARIFRDKYPQHAGFFELRQVRGLFQKVNDEY